MSATPTKAAPKKKAAGTKSKAPANHPPYVEMVRAAISSEQGRTGASRQKIVKYIKANYKVNESAESQIKMALKRGVVKGDITQVKGTGASGSFKLAKKAGGQAAPKKAPVKKAATTKSPAKKAPAAAATAKKPAAKKATKSPAKKSPPAKKKAPAKASTTAAKTKKQSVKKTPTKKPASASKSPKKASANKKKAGAKKTAAKKAPKK